LTKRELEQLDELRLKLGQRRYDPKALRLHPKRKTRISA